MTSNERLPAIPPADMTPDQSALLKRIQQVTGRPRGFITARDDGAMVGPYNVLLHQPTLGSPAWALIQAVGADDSLEPAVREVATLVTGAHFSCRYELYAHEHTATTAGLSDEQVASLAVGVRPEGLSSDQSAAYDVATALVGGGQLPSSTYRRSVAQLGDDGTAALCFLVGAYCLVSVLLNAYDADVPGSDESRLG